MPKKIIPRKIGLTIIPYIKPSPIHKLLKGRRSSALKIVTNNKTNETNSDK